MTDLQKLTDAELLARLERIEASARYDRFARDSEPRHKAAWLSVAAEIERRRVAS